MLAPDQVVLDRAASALELQVGNRNGTFLSVATRQLTGKVQADRSHRTAMLPPRTNIALPFHPAEECRTGTTRQELVTPTAQELHAWPGKHRDSEGGYPVRAS